MKVKPFLLLFCTVSYLFGGGLVTNTNQSAEFIRMMNRNASIDADAVYFNPAGTAFMEEGMHLYVSNQSILQTKIINNNYPYLHNGKYEGQVKALVFPNIYSVINRGKLAFSLGFGPIGGGGSAEFEKGLPSFELPYSDLKPGLGQYGVTDYGIDLYFKGSSVYYGITSNIAYKINDMLAISIGGRYVSAVNKYEGYLKNVTVTQGENVNPAPAQDFFNNLSGSAAQAAQYYSNIGMLDSAAYFATVAAQMAAKAILMADQEADVTQKGSSVIPVIGLNVKLNDNLMVSFRYEMKGSMKVKNETKKDVLVGYTQDGDPITKFPDGAEIGSDIPSMVAFGAFAKFSPKLKVMSDINYFINSDIDWDGKEEYVNNEYEVGVGAEYDFLDKLSISAGYLLSRTGAMENYQSDMTYGLDSQTIGVGGKFILAQGVFLSAGFSTTFYSQSEKNFTHLLDTQSIPVVEKYDKTASVFAVGLGFSF
ncbi:MAG: outer membrane protein transport protein [Candidatus Marinimicrobia bacterium]|nr:outer membrane protein transport protein [Candidatus Neomarinimicrobiota bacterium]